MRLDPTLKPRRADDLEIRAVPDGYDGLTPVGALPALFAAAFRLDGDAGGEVAGCLERLVAEGLLVGVPDRGGRPV